MSMTLMSFYYLCTNIEKDIKNDMRSLGPVLCSRVKCSAKSSVTRLGSPPGTAAHKGHTTWIFSNDVWIILYLKKERVKFGQQPYYFGVLMSRDTHLANSQTLSKKPNRCWQYKHIKHLNTVKLIIHIYSVLWW